MVALQNIQDKIDLAVLAYKPTNYSTLPKDTKKKKNAYPKGCLVTEIYNEVVVIFE